MSLRADANPVTRFQTLVPVPCPADHTCDATWTQPGQLGAHLMIDHLWASGKALGESRMLFDVTAPAEPPAPAAASEPFDLAAHRRAQKPPRPHAPKESDQPSPSKEPPMPDAKPKRTKPRPPPMADRTCGACGDKGHRSDHCPHRASAGRPAPAKAAPTCGYCHRTDGHSKNCKKGPCKICARSESGKCGWHSGERGKPGPKGTRSEKPANTNALGASDLTRIKAAIAEHERKAAALREALAILDG